MASIHVQRSDPSPSWSPENLCPSDYCTTIVSSSDMCETQSLSFSFAFGLLSVKTTGIFDLILRMEEIDTGARYVH